MFFAKIQTPGIAHVAYLIGDGGEAAVVDPRRDIDEYVARARENGLTVRYVLETHRQEDFVSGARALAERTGAKVVTGDHPLFGHADVRLRDGQAIAVGSVKIRALATPGHTPESTSYAVFVEDAPERALGVFTGDALFVGSTGRTDLTDPKKTGEHAAALHDAVHAKLLPLGDQAIIWPAHGAGSVCGGNIADRDESTLGLERTYNPVFTKSREAFVAIKVQERLPRPPYFARMEKVNLGGGAPLDRAEVALLDARALDEKMRGALVIDAREPEAFAGGHVPGSINVWMKGLPVFGGWVAREAARVLLVVPGIDQASQAVLHLARIGVDRVEGVLAGGFEAWRDAGMPIAYGGTTDPRRLSRELDETTVLDVRDDTEFEEGHIHGARHLYVGYLEQHLDRIRADLARTPSVTVTCSVGHRSGVAASLLERGGFRDVKNLLGGMTAWKKLGLPITKDREHSITTFDVEGARR